MDITYPYSLCAMRNYELYENYTFDRTQALGYANDTSFMVETSLVLGYSDAYKFTSNKNQVVTVVVLPVVAGDFDLEILNERGVVIAQSNTVSYIDWIQIRVPAGTRLQARVKTTTGGLYRLFVTGSSEYVNKVNVTVYM